MPIFQVKVKDIPVRYGNTTYPAGAVFAVDEEDLKSMQLLVEVIGEIGEEPVELEKLEKPIGKMNVEELQAYATLKNIDLGTATTKKDILATIDVAFKEKKEE